MRRHFTAVATPERLRKRPLDPRGYPIPFAVVVTNGKAYFTINDEHKRMQIVRNDLCSLCGEKLLRGRWFIGGHGAAFHPQGAYLDMPMHDECAHYALQVCPYIALPRFAHEIGGKQAEQIDDAVVIRTDETVENDRPEVFVAVMAVGQRMVADGAYVKPSKPYRKVEYWRHGAQITEAEAQPFIKELIADA